MKAHELFLSVVYDLNEHSLILTCTYFAEWGNETLSCRLIYLYQSDHYHLGLGVGFRFLISHDFSSCELFWSKAGGQTVSG